MLRLIALLLTVSVFGGCYLFTPRPDWCVEKEFGPGDYPDLAIMVKNSCPRKEPALEKSVEKEFDIQLTNKGYGIVARGEKLRSLAEEQKKQLSDLTRDGLIELGNVANADALIIVSLLEFDTTQVQRKEENNQGREVTVQRFLTTAKVAAELLDLESGLTLWNAKFDDQTESLDRRPDTALLDEVARLVAATCSPRPWYWYLYH